MPADTVWALRCFSLPVAPARLHSSLGSVDSTEMKPKPRRRLILGLAAASVALLALTLLTTSAKYSPRTERLADGSFLEIVSISCGTNHQFVLPQRKPWKTFLVKHLPTSWTARLGWWAESAAVELAHEPGLDELAIFTICDLARSNSFCSPKLVLLDEQGIVYDSVGEGAVVGGSGGKQDWKLVGWKLSNIPRNSKRLILRFSQLGADGTTRQDAAQFSIPNPLVKAE